MQLSELAPRTLLDVQTAGSRHRVIVCDPASGEALIQGGSAFPRYAGSPGRPPEHPVRITIARVPEPSLHVVKRGPQVRRWPGEVTQGGRRFLEAAIQGRPVFPDGGRGFPHALRAMLPASVGGPVV